MKEAATNNVEIDDVDSETMWELLRFIYCGEVRGFKEIAKDLIYAAEKYEVDALKENCIEELVMNVTEENVIETLIIADRISGTEKLLKACIPIVRTYVVKKVFITILTDRLNFQTIRHNHEELEVEGAVKGDAADTFDRNNVPYTHDRSLRA
jgi:hypothetical protein